MHSNPQPASAPADRIHDSQHNSVPAHPAFGVNLSRRNLFMGSVAVLASTTAAVAAPSIAAAATGPGDPIFAVLDAYRQAHEAYIAAFSDEELEEMGEPHSRAFQAVLRTRPTTPAGLAALTNWARDQVYPTAETAETWLAEDLCTLNATIDDATRGMAGLEPWSPRLHLALDDPIYAAVEAHIAAEREHLRKVHVSAALHDTDPGYDEAFAVTAAADEVRYASMDALLEVEPTTIAGLLALVDHVEAFNCGEVHRSLGYQFDGHTSEMWPDFDDDDVVDDWGRRLNLPYAFWMLRHVRKSLAKLTANA
jgi:hypothetical protein